MPIPPQGGPPGSPLNELNLKPEAIVVPSAHGEIIWPDGTRASAGSDGRSVLGPDGRVLQAADGQPLRMTPEGLIEPREIPWRIAVYPSGRALALAMVRNPKRPAPPPARGTTKNPLFTDCHRNYYTADGDRIATDTLDEPLCSRDGRFVIFEDKPRRYFLQDGSKVALGPDGRPAVWLDGSIVVVGADDRTVLTESNKVFTRKGVPVEVNADGTLVEEVGSYVLFATKPGDTPASDQMIHTRSIQLKETLNNTNMELRGAKDALETAKAELLKQKARADGLEKRVASLTGKTVELEISKAEASVAAVPDTSSLRLTHSREIAELKDRHARMVNEMKEANNRRSMELQQLQTKELTEVQLELKEHHGREMDETVQRYENELGSARMEVQRLVEDLRVEDEDKRKQRWEAENVIADLQRELREAAHEDAAALERLKLAVESQAHRVTAREEELQQARSRLEAEEKKARAAEDKLASSQAAATAAYSKLLESHEALQADYTTLRERAHALEESHLASSSDLKEQLISLKNGLSESQRDAARLREASDDLKTSAARRAAEREKEWTSQKTAEVKHLRHLLTLEEQQRERAEAALDDLRKTHEAHVEEYFNQVTSLTLERDQLGRQFRELERTVDEANWEKSTASKEVKRLKEEAAHSGKHLADVQGDKARAEAELAQEKLARQADSREFMSRLEEASLDRERAINVIPCAISDAERAKALAEERLAAYQRQVAEQSGEADRLREEVSALQKTCNALRQAAKHTAADTEHELARLQAIESEYRRDRLLIENRLDEKIRTDTTGEVAELQRELEKMTKKKDKAERRRVALEAMALRNEKAAANAMALEEEVALLTREKEELKAELDSQESRWERIVAQQEHRDYLVDGLRQQLATMQRDDHGGRRMASVPPAHVTATSAVSPMAWGQTPRARTHTPHSPKRFDSPTHKHNSRWTSPLREHPSDVHMSLTTPGASEYAQKVRQGYARPTIASSSPPRQRSYIGGKPPSPVNRKRPFR
ncbi:hypothetical protein DIPPA_03675 [Diplonema papillatum]|nr:hypothetical protein DIPPA_03675 [Diplonema papillatum]